MTKEQHIGATFSQEQSRLTNYIKGRIGSAEDAEDIAQEVFVDLNSCDGCGMCAEVCPEEVFEMRTLSDEQRSNLKFKGRLKVRVKGDLRSNIINADACIGCGKCVRLCHEHAIVVKDLSKRA